MNIRIYQINSELDKDHVKESNYSKTLKYAGRINPSIYRTVFDGNVEFTKLKDLFTIFTYHHPVSFQGHNLNVSDVIEVVDTFGDIKKGFYFVDDFSFKQLYFTFDRTKAEPLQGLRMLVVEPEKLPYEALICNDNHSIQKAVNGYYCNISLPGNICLLCNEDGKRLRLKENRIIGNDVICGTFLISKFDGVDDFTDLSDDEVSYFKRIFESSDSFAPVYNTFMMSL